MARWWGRSNRDDRLEHVEALMVWLTGIGLVSFIIMLVFGLGTVSLDAFGGFFLWAVLAALASLFAGGALGLLFGLPTVRRVEITTVAQHSNLASQPGSAPTTTGTAIDDVPLGYAESTNLEQVADWLTKIIVGLTLTQYSLWEARFARLSYDLSYRLLGSPACSPACDEGIFPAGSTIPGGALIVFYALLGFLIAYLWMRGYFITEMEAARRNAKYKARLKRLADEREDDAARRLATAKEEQRKAEINAEAERQRARDQGVLQERGTVVFTAAEASKIADTVSFTADEAKEAVSEIRDAIAAGTEPDDPWLGQFGRKPEDRGLLLSATATPTSADPHYYDVVLRIEATNAKLREDIVGKSARVFLHPSFGGEPRIVYFGADGVAQLSLLAYGAFTVGVLVENGTKLELNLATIPGVDPGFLSR